MNDRPKETRWSAEIIRANNEGRMIGATGIDPCHIDVGRCIATMAHRKDLTQPMNIFHGGAIVTLADAAATCAALTLTDPEATRNPALVPLTIQISANLIRNTDHGRITATAEVVHSGRTTQVVQTTVTDEDGRLLAVVTTTHVVVRRDE
jgi:uncharacterized protein (TIGR00369 family)